MYAAYIYYPWESKEDAHVFTQNTLDDFYKNLYEFIKIEQK
jgi:hypothetical protein